MKRKLVIIAGALAAVVISAGIPAAFADEAPTDPGTSASPSPDLVFNEDGTVAQGDEEYSSITWQSTEPPVEKPDGRIHAASCPEVKDPPWYVETKKREFIIDKGEPYSSWLQPGQTAEYTTEKAHEIGATVTVGGTSEVGAWIAKVAVKLEISASYKFTVKKNFKVSDTNKGKAAYRVRLGNMGWRIVETKHWVTSPCVVHSQVTWNVAAPEPGDITLGRFNS